MAGGVDVVTEGSDIHAQIDAHRHEMARSDHLACFDGDKHAENRQLMTDLLTCKRLKANEECLYGLVDDLIDGFTHGCLGAPLSQLENRTAIERLLARTREIRISEAHHRPIGARRYRYEPTYSSRSLTELHIEFDAA